MSTSSDQQRLVSYKTRFGKGVLIWRDGLLVAHAMPGTLPGKHAVILPGIPATSATAMIPRSRMGEHEERLAGRLEAYFAGERIEFPLAELSLDSDLWTPFQREVATALAAISYGRTISYAELAEAAGHPGAQRAVGNFMAANPFPVLIPCHRVLPASGAPGNFAAGRDWKVRLLGLESRPVAVEQC